MEDGKKKKKARGGLLSRSPHGRRQLRGGGKEAVGVFDPRPHLGLDSGFDDQARQKIGAAALRVSKGGAPYCALLVNVPSTSPAHKTAQFLFTITSLGLQSGSPQSGGPCSDRRGYFV